MQSWRLSQLLLLLLPPQHQGASLLVAGEHLPSPVKQEVPSEVGPAAALACRLQRPPSTESPPEQAVTPAAPAPQTQEWESYAYPL